MMGEISVVTTQPDHKKIFVTKQSNGNMSQSEIEPFVDQDLLDIFVDAEDPVLTAVEVGDILDISQQAAYARLDRAEKEGMLERKKTGSRSVVWWVKDSYSIDSV
jgi:Fic family protein